MAPEDISGYSLRRALGSGSAGTVWLLRDLATGRHAVLKRIPKSIVAASSDFLRDLDLARTIDHPHIARLLEVRESDREWLLFSQHIAAGTLTSLLERRGTLSPGELVTLITPLAQALATLHRTGLTHGHLTPNNIMFDANGRPVITDPGLRSLPPHPPLQPTTPATPMPSATPALPAAPTPSATPALPATPTPSEADLAALATITHQSGGTPQTFPSSLFITTPDQIAHHALHHSHPLPIDLSFPPTPPPNSSNPAPPQLADPAPSNHANPTPDNLANPASPQLATPAPPNSANPTPNNLANPASPQVATPAPPNSASGHDPSRPTSPSTFHRAPATFHPTPATSHPTPVVREPLPRDRGRNRLTRPTHRRSASRQSKCQSASQTAPRLLRSRRGAYGILAACGAGAVATVLIGLATLGILGHPATGASAVADQSTQPQPTPTTAQQPTPTTAQPTPTTPTTAQPTATPAQPTPSGSRATSATPGTTTHRTTKQWLQTLQALDIRRSHAFTTLNPAALNTVYLPGSPPWSADRALLTSYRDQHLRIEGLRLQIQSVSVESPGPKTVVLRIVDRLVAGTAITASGQRTPFPPGRPTARRVTLTATATSWRISAIAKA